MNTCSKPWNFTEADVNSGKLPTAGTLEFDYVSTNVRFRQCSNAYTMPGQTFALLCQHLRQIRRSIPQIAHSKDEAAAVDLEAAAAAEAAAAEQREISQFFQRSTGMARTAELMTKVQAVVRGHAVSSCLFATTAAWDTRQP